MNQFGGRLAVNGVMDLVLHRSEKILGERMVGVVIHAGCVDIGNFLIKAPLAGADVLQTAGQLIEIIPAFAGFFQAHIIQHKALDDVLLQLVIGPLAEAHTNRAAHPKAQGQHHVQIVVGHLVLFAIGGSCSEKPNN